MGIRGEIYSSKVTLPNRTYFFNVKENRMGDIYLNIVESKNRDAGGFDRQSVILFADDLQDFLKGFDESLRMMEKSVRDKKRGDGAKREEKFERTERAERSERPDRGERSERGERTERGERSERGERKERGEKFGRGERAGYGERKERGERTDRADRGAKGERTFSRGPKGGSSFRGKPDRGAKDNYHRSGEKSGRGDRERGSDRARSPKGGKRVVVRKSER
jgi:hypothetical protein